MWNYCALLKEPCACWRHWANPVPAPSSTLSCYMNISHQVSWHLATQISAKSDPPHHSAASQQSPDSLLPRDYRWAADAPNMVFHRINSRARQVMSHTPQKSFKFFLVEVPRRWHLLLQTRFEQKSLSGVRAGSLIHGVRENLGVFSS